MPQILAAKGYMTRLTDAGTSNIKMSGGPLASDVGSAPFASKAEDAALRTAMSTPATDMRLGTADIVAGVFGFGLP